MHGVLKPTGRAHVSGHERSAVEADAHLEAVAEGLLAHTTVEPEQSCREHLARRRKSPIRVVVERNRCSEHAEEAVAAVADQSPPVVENRIDHFTEVFVEKIDDAVRWRCFGESRELSDIGEHHSADTATAAEAKILIRPLQDVIHDVLGHKSGEHPAHPLAFHLVETLLRQCGVDPSAQENRIEGLGEVILGADLDTADDSVDLVDRRDHDHRHVLKHGIALQSLEHRDAVELGHDDVEQDNVERILAQDLERLLAVCRGADPVALLLEAAGQEHPVERVVVDDEDAAGEHVNAHQPSLRAVLRPFRPRPTPPRPAAAAGPLRRAQPRSWPGFHDRDPQSWSHRVDRCKQSRGSARRRPEVAPHRGASTPSRRVRSVLPGPAFADSQLWRAFLSSAISPKNSPAARVATRLPFFVTSTSPSMITKNSWPTSPSLQSTLPAGTSRSSLTLAS